MPAAPRTPVPSRQIETGSGTGDGVGLGSGVGVGLGSGGRGLGTELVLSKMVTGSLKSVTWKFLSVMVSTPFNKVTVSPFAKEMAIPSESVMPSPLPGRKIRRLSLPAKLF